MRLVIPPGVFRPRSDSRMLARAGCAVPPPPGGTALELCCGSGAVAVALARRGWRTTAVDVSRRAVLAARVNGRLNGVQVRARRGDLYAAVPGETFDLIVANPPYIPAATDDLPGRGPERALDGGTDGRLVLDRVLDGAPAHLRPGGQVLVVHSEFNGIEASLERLRGLGLRADVAERHRGPLGPVVRGRMELLVRRGLLPEGATEEDVVIVKGARG